MRSAVIKDFKRHVGESKKRAMQFTLNASGRRNLSNLDANSIGDYLDIEEPKKSLQKGLERLNKNTKIYKKHYHFRKRMFEYWKRFYDIYYEELRNDIKKIVKLLEKVDYFLIKNETARSATAPTAPAIEAE